jgi:hypothetical protein
MDEIIGDYIFLRVAKKLHPFYAVHQMGKK